MIDILVIFLCVSGVASDQLGWFILNLSLLFKAFGTDGIFRVSAGSLVRRRTCRISHRCKGGNRCAYARDPWRCKASWIRLSIRCTSVSSSSGGFARSACKFCKTYCAQRITRFFRFYYFALNAAILERQLGPPAMMFLTLQLSLSNVFCFFNSVLAFSYFLFS